MDVASHKPDVLLTVGLFLAWLSALLLFTPLMQVMTWPTEEIASVGAASLADLHELCGSSLGSLTRALDEGTRRDCSRIQALVVTLYLALVAGVALLVSGMVTKEHWGTGTVWYVGLALFCLVVFLLYASYHIVAIPISGGTAYRVTFF